MRYLVLVFALCSCLATAPACGAVLSALPVVSQIITDAALVIDTIESFTENVPDVPDTARADVRKAIQDCRVALASGRAAVKGAESLNQGDIDAAFADFREAYAHLLLLVEPMGVKPQRGGLFGATPEGGLSVPMPEDLTASSS